MSQETVPEQALPASPPSSRQVALGLFILFQLAFLILGNLLGFFKWVGPELSGEPKQLVNRLAPKFADEEGHLWSWNDKAEGCTRRWMQLTGQDQDWYLFSSASKATGFPVVLLLWEDEPASGPSIPGSKLEYNSKDGFNLVTPWPEPGANPNVVWLPSENAPLDANNYIKLGKARVRRIEGEFYQNALPYENDTRERAAERMTERMQKLMRNAHDPALRYLQWRLKHWRLAHPDEPAPKQAILFERFYRIHGPEEPRGWDGPFLIPQARWFVSAQQPPGQQYILEPFDYSEQRFKPMPQ